MVRWKESVKRDLRKLDPPVARRVALGIERQLTTENAAPEPLRGEFRGQFKVRVGDYRAIVERSGGDWVVLRVGHRSEIYG